MERLVHVSRDWGGSTALWRKFNGYVGDELVDSTEDTTITSGKLAARAEVTCFRADKIAISSAH